MCIRYHIRCMYCLMHIYGLMRISHPIFLMYIISHVLAISHVLMEFLYHTYLWTSDLLCDVTTYGSNAVYISFYGLYNFYGLRYLELIYSFRCNSNNYCRNNLQETQCFRWGDNRSLWRTEIYKNGNGSRNHVLQ